ncbi:uncharacterized protein METZ01_LOCUS142279 [marine metagenome]|uniref:Uncharacterized protein n=1 Tax=marine metagenome TaxID=408172 RepID=A0A381ZJH5_9ZZZZ
MDELVILEILNKMWPMLIGFIMLVIVLAQMHTRIRVLEEKTKVLFSFHNQVPNRRQDDS